MLLNKSEKLSRYSQERNQDSITESERTKSVTIAKPHAQEEKLDLSNSQELHAKIKRHDLSIAIQSKVVVISHKTLTETRQYTRKTLILENEINHSKEALFENLRLPEVW